MIFFIQTGASILAEVDSVSAFTAVCGREAELAPVGSLLVELETGIVVASKTSVAQYQAWDFAVHLEFEDQRTARLA